MRSLYLSLYGIKCFSWCLWGLPVLAVLIYSPQRANPLLYSLIEDAWGRSPILAIGTLIVGSLLIWLTYQQLNAPVKLLWCFPLTAATNSASHQGWLSQRGMVSKYVNFCLRMCFLSPARAYTQRCSLAVSLLIPNTLCLSLFYSTGKKSSKY